jgi:hypothetical protein
MLHAPPIDPFVLQDVLYRVGFALWQIQELESTIAHYLVMVHKLEPGVAREEAESVLEKTRKKTLGQLLGQLKSQDPVPNQLIERLDHFVEHRNWLAHRSRTESRSLVYQPSRNQELFSRLDWVAAEALALMKLFAEELVVHLESHGFSREEIDKRAAKLMQQWENGQLHGADRWERAPTSPSCWR